MLIKQFYTDENYHAMIVKHEWGHLCGYIGIANNHILYNYGYGDNIDFIKNKDIEDMKQGKRGEMALLHYALSEPDDGVRIDIYFDTHGSLTFSDFTKIGFSDLWYFGFDCGHNRDKFNPKSLDYVIDECKSLSKQLYDLNVKYNNFVQEGNKNE